MTAYADDEIETPSWMTDEFFKKILVASKSDDSISITDVKLIPAASKNDHFASVMVRAVIQYDTASSKTNTKSLIIKMMPEVAGYKMDLLAERDIFETEIGMYYEIIPKLEAELRKIGDDTVLGPKALYSSLEPPKLIVLEDIIPKGYTTLQSSFANMEEAKAVFSKLAKMHAVSYKLVMEGDQTIPKYRSSLLNSHDIKENEFCTRGMENFIAKLEATEDLQKYVPRLRKIEPHLLDRCIAISNLCFQKGAKGIFALCHGDFHAKNMMFKRNAKGVLEDVLLVDFQLASYGSPIMDVIYGLYLVIGEDLRKDHRDEIVHHYASTFVETLKRLNFQGDMPSISDFFIELLRYRDWDLFMFSTFMPIWYAVSAYELSVSDMMTSNDARRSAYHNKRFMEEMRRILPIMFHQGYLD